MTGPRQHSRLIIPADGKKRGGRRVVIRVDTRGGTTIQRSLLNPTEEEMRAALDMSTDCKEWLGLRRVATAAQLVISDGCASHVNDLAEALAALNEMQARRSEP